MRVDTIVGLRSLAVNTGSTFSSEAHEFLARLFGPSQDLVYHKRYVFRQESIVVEHNPLFTILKVYDLESEAPVTLKVFSARDMGADMLEIAGRMWDSEVRVLMRLFPYRWRRPGLVRFVDGDFDEDTNTFFVAWENAYRLTLADVLANPAMSPAALQDLPVRVDLLCMLCEALYELHSHGIIHREISPRAICVWEERPPRAAISEFGMSVFLNNMLWVPMQPSGSGASVPTRALAYSAPERLAFLAGGGQLVDAGEDYRQDIYSLGLIAVEWFTRRFDEGWSDRFLPGPGAYLEYNHFEWIQDQVWPRIDEARLTSDHEAEQALKALLHRMVEFNPTQRFATAGQLVRTTQEVRSLFRQRVFRELCKRPFKIIFDPKTCATHLDAISTREVPLDSLPPDERQEEIRKELQEDLSGDQILVAPDTHPRWRTASGGGNRWLLRGTHRLYRLEVFRSRSHSNIDCPWLAVVFQIVRGSEGWRSAIPVPFSSIEVIPIQRVRPHVRNAFPPPDVGSWHELMVHVRDALGAEQPDRPRGHRVLLQALAECVELQSATADLETYAYRAVLESGDTFSSKLLTLEADPVRDREFVEDHAYMSAFEGTRGERTSFAQWLRTLDVGRRLEMAQRPSGLREFRQRVRGIVESWDLAAGRVRVRVPPGVQNNYPAEGFVRIEQGDTARAQDEAVKKLADDTFRLDLLETPGAMQVRSPASEAAWITLDTPDANKKAVIDGWSRAYPLFLLQGPPGTGKTTTANEMIAQIKKSERGARILVTAQSHEALDNLLESVLAHKAKNMTILRLPSGKYEPRIDAIAKVQPLRAVDTLLNRAVHASDTYRERLEQTYDVDPRGLQDFCDSWRGLLARRPAELLDLVYQTSDVVFSSCLGAKRLDRYEVGTFDWVIVEEAARAHGTELLIPLMRADRWVLIGDHLQLEPFKADIFRSAFQTKVEAELRRIDDQNPEAKLPDDEGQLEKAELQRSHQYLAMFSYLFENASREQKDTLTGCYRMHPRQVELVDRLFYRKDGPDSNIPVLIAQVPAEKRTHRFRTTGPGGDWLSGKAIVWLDTSTHTYRRERILEQGETSRSNLLEALIIRRFVELLRGHSQSPSLMLLSVYKAQQHLLDANVGDWPDGRALTVMSAQGKEADVVVLSLVRSNAEEAAGRAIGDVQRDSFLNVALSRAKELLVLVGDLEHFRLYGEKAGRVGDLIRILETWTRSPGVDDVAIHRPLDLVAADYDPALSIEGMGV